MSSQVLSDRDANIAMSHDTKAKGGAVQSQPKALHARLGEDKYVPYNPFCCMRTLPA